MLLFALVLSLALTALSYVLYPSVLLLVERFCRTDRVADGTPSVSMLISAYNEADVIANKIANALQLDYPRELLEIIVISDASTDGTDDIVASFADRGVMLCRQDTRVGKSAGLTRVVPQARGDVLVFSDANSIYEPDALRKLVRHFEDQRVGFVAGHQRYYSDNTASAASESLYWRYETAIKVLESRTGSVVCGDGAILAVRRELFEPLAADDINDFTLPLKIVIRGYRGIFDPEAVCYEHAAADFAGEFRRRVRIVNRSFRAVCRNWRALSPFHVGTFAVRLFLHKVLRWFVPFLLLIALATNVALVFKGVGPLLQVLLGIQLLGYSLAGLYILPPFRQFRPVYSCFYFCVANAAAGLGILGFLLGRNYRIWTPERGVPNSAKTDSGSERAKVLSLTSMSKGT